MTVARRHYTDTEMPPYGVAEALTSGNSTLTQHGDLFRFWLLTHTARISLVTGPLFWITAVLRECLPEPDGNMDFIAIGEPLR